jgi:hypothetical protein
MVFVHILSSMGPLIDSAAHSQSPGPLRTSDSSVPALNSGNVLGGTSVTMEISSWVHVIDLNANFPSGFSVAGDSGWRRDGGIGVVVPS